MLAKIKSARSAGALLICPVVLAELRAYPGATAAFVLRFLDDTGVTVDFRLDETVWTEVGERYGRYAARRRKSLGSFPRRLIADFLIGAHALVQADRLITLDAGFYRRNFPEVRLL